MKLKFLLLSLITMLVIFMVISASGVNAASSSSISVDMIPSSPAPGENVSITLSSYANNLDSVLITWSLDGRTVSSGIGKKSFSLTAPGAGSEVVVTAIISLPEGSVEKRMIIRSSLMVLLWQANDSYVPPFYKGKAMPSVGSEIKVVAMPEIKVGSDGTVNPKSMTYSWKEDDTNNVEGSGYGKNSFVFINDYLEDSNNIGVTASTIDQTYSSEASINVGIVEPKILFYKYDNSLGILWEKILPDFHRIQDTEIVEATPYFISPKDIRNPTLIWSWFINDTQINTPIFRKNVMPLRVESGTSGISRLRLRIENQYKIFQTTDGEIDLEF
ncbi:hypothetical protein A3A95_00260 [Candidatus Nomurabacteria bacterium RIFCSPLOWO2_01_FULL_39_18]|uniref:Uncharacterized protein n=1 Tax=Candidatus Nomurabacteria bacterium RIFCSPHIGHO2_01_FULL_40_24b TaxID=1801739 RepID=A0A1F6V8Z2_9BACT|nr:MAG: hypothetical protein A2647_03110 [Candidatus Nomurabacteria bacterium RIFCSPHIGHO2_01_FULL_40_24b]OGI90509.1 MAG: hypothetical protein A3A95_00260 [Candidatus Nomurabacteria bacterium RIFCSPLOWO2_01_FULL_39_18]